MGLINVQPDNTKLEDMTVPWFHKNGNNDVDLWPFGGAQAHVTILL